MKYKIVADSCCEFPKEWENDERFERVALGLEVGGKVIMDDETFDQAQFLKEVSGSRSCPRSFCPSPQKYVEAYDCDADVIFVFTLSSKLSGSFNAAAQGRRIYLDSLKKANLPLKQIFICDSKSASGGETHLAMKAYELCESNLPYKDICLKLMFLCNSMKTYFVLDSLDALKKNGRMTSVESLLADALHIKPVLCGLDGEIAKLDQALGLHKAYEKLIDKLIEDVKNIEKRTVIISQCNALDKANEIKDLILSKVHNAKVIIMDTKGVSSLYAGNGGIVVTV